jgi:hypothetical protein
MTELCCCHSNTDVFWINVIQNWGDEVTWHWYSYSIQNSTLNVVSVNNVNMLQRQSWNWTPCKAPLVSSRQLLWELIGSCDKSQGCKVIQQRFSSDCYHYEHKGLHVYGVSLFGKIIRVSVLRGFNSVSLIFNQFLHVCRIYSWLWINSLYTIYSRWNFMDQHLIWGSSNKLLAFHLTVIIMSIKAFMFMG